MLIFPFILNQCIAYARISNIRRCGENLEKDVIKRLSPDYHEEKNLSIVPYIIPPHQEKKKEERKVCA